MPTWLIGPSATGPAARALECDAALAALNTPEGWTYAQAPDGAHDGTHWLSGGVATARPEMAITLPETLAAGASLGLSGLPEGTLWTIYDETDEALMPALAASGAVGADGLLGETLDDSGRYRVDIGPPFPWRPLEFFVDVA